MITNKKPSHVRHFNMSDELQHYMEEQRLEDCLNLTHQTEEYDDESVLIHISIPTYQAQ